MKTRVTIRDIAQTAGVSVGTVSRVLSGATNVAPDLYHKTLRVIEETRYRPARAIQLRREKQQCLSVFFNVSEKWLHSYWVTEYLRGVSEACAPHDYTTTIYMHNRLPDNNFFNKVKACSDGLILMSGLMDFRISEQTSRLKSSLEQVSQTIPVIGLGGVCPALPISQIAFDDIGAGTLATERLIEFGHRRIAFINTNPEHAGFAERGLGYMVVMRRHGLWDEALMLEHAVTIPRPDLPEESPPDLDRALDLALKRKASAVVVSNDWGCAGLYQACARRKIRIPEDLSVIGFDNEFSICSLLNPTLSSVENPFYKLGKVGAERLFQEITARDNRQETTPITQYIQGNVIQRDSIGPNA